MTAPGSPDRRRAREPADPRDPLRRIADFAAQVTGLAHACLIFVDGPAVRMLAATEEKRPAFLARLDERVARSGEPAVIGDLSRPDPTFAEQLGSRERTGSYLAVPLRDSAGEPIGTLSVNDSGPRILHDRHRRLLRDLGAIAADQLDLMRRADALDDDHHAGAELAEAIAAGEIVPWYQPMIDLRTETVIGVEALARRTLPGGGVIGPHAFIPIAEQTDLIIELDLAVIRHALADLRALQAIRPGLRMSLNLSGRHLDHDDWADVIRQATDDAGVLAPTVLLELTETARPTDLESGRAMMARVRSLGFEIWFDDFGTGWSALQDLLQLPVDGIKLDRSFAADLGSHADDAIIRALISAAAELGLKVTIEGIETAEQLAQAKALGCDHAQGFYWSPALPLEELVQLLRGTAS